MLAIVKSMALKGMESYPVSVEVDVSNGIPGFEIVGLPETAVKESKERVKAALRNSDFLFPSKKIIVNLAPADLKKEGTLLDLPIALGLLIASGQLDVTSRVNDFYFIGELSLDGGISSVNGVLPLVDGLGSKVNNLQVCVPFANGGEGALSNKATVYPIENLKQLVKFLEGEIEISPVFPSETDFDFSAADDTGSIDMSNIKGQHIAKRAMEIAAAGGHNILLIGVPGSGKTMLAKSMPTILPPLTIDEALETTRIYSLNGALGDSHIIKNRPFCSPHHTSSAVSLIGGGHKIKPGEISMATNGVLFLDEIVEFPKSVLQVLRQPLEDHVVQIARANGSVQYPAKFQLVGACNPCPCGYYGDPEKDCTCTVSQIKKYMNRLGGPLLDRLDLHVSVGRVGFDDLHTDSNEESSAVIRERVIGARKIQEQRYEGLSITTNAQLDRNYIEKYCHLDADTEKTLARIFDKLKLTARSHDRLIKVARTIADLANSEKIDSLHLMEAVQYRSLDRL